MFAAYAVSGLGMGSMYANALLWVEQFLPVRGRVAALLNSCGAVGVMLSPLILGNLIDLEPMALPYTQLAITLLSLLIFGLGSVFGAGSWRRRGRSGGWRRRGRRKSRSSTRRIS